MYVKASKRITDELDEPELEKELKGNRGRHGTKAALLLNLIGAIFPADQQWLLYLVLVHLLNDFDNPMYSVSLLLTAYIWRQR
jgi:hypothetical protein